MWKLLWLILAVICGVIATFNWIATPKFNFMAAGLTCLAISFLPVDL